MEPFLFKSNSRNFETVLCTENSNFTFTCNPVYEEHDRVAFMSSDTLTAEECPSNLLFRGKRSYLSVEEPESGVVPRKIHVSEELISSRFSTLEISGSQSASEQLSTLAPDSCHNSLTDNRTAEDAESLAQICWHASSTGRSTENDSLFNEDVAIDDIADDNRIVKLQLPEELRTDFRRLKSTGTISDMTIHRLLAPKPCLDLVPFNPNNPHIQLSCTVSKAITSSPVSSSATPKDDEMELMTTPSTPMPCATPSYPFPRSILIPSFAQQPFNQFHDDLATDSSGCRQFFV